MSFDSFIRELDFFGISYNEEDIIDGDKIIVALKKENSELRQQIQKDEELAADDEKNSVSRLLFKAIIEEVYDLKARLDNLGKDLFNDPDFDSREFLIHILIYVGLIFLS